MDDLDFLNQEPNENLQPTQQIQPIDNEATEKPFEAPSWEDVKAGKIKYEDLPPNMKSKVKQEAYEETPDDKKYLWDEYNYTPPETYHGIDRNGKKVDALGLDGFEELVKRGRIKPKTKIEQDVENLTHIVKEQSKTILTQRESELDKRLMEAKESALNGSLEDFETYEKLLSEKQDLKFQKLQLEKKVDNVEPVQPVTQQPDLSEQYSVEDQAALQVFGNNPENKTFIDIMATNKEMQEEFDKAGAFLKNKNPNVSLDRIAAAAKTIVENKFNLNKQQKPMFRNTIQPEQKTNIQSKPTQKITYNSLSDRDKKWVNSEAKSGRAIYAGKTLDEIANAMYGKLLKK